MVKEPKLEKITEKEISGMRLFKGNKDTLYTTKEAALKSFHITLKKEGFVVCQCGIVLDIDTAKQYQYDMDRRRQRVVCPVCRNELWESEYND